MASVTSADVSVIWSWQAGNLITPADFQRHSCSRGKALPISILISSAVCSPIIRLNFLRT